MLGQAQPLGEKEVEKLHEVRQRYNHSAPARKAVGGNGLEAEGNAEKTVSSQG
jgi:hypothetical protein